MQGGKTRIKQPIQDMVWFSQLKNMIRMSKGIQELSQLWGKQMFSAIIEMKKVTMHVNVQNPKFVMQNILESRCYWHSKMKLKANLGNEENDFMLYNAYGDNTLEELNAVAILMARIQPTDDKSDVQPTYDVEFISDVNDSQIDMINGLLSKSDHEQHHHENLETIIHTSAHDQIDFDIIFDDPYMDNNSGQSEHDTNAHDQSLHDFESLIINLQLEAKNNAQ
uniref:Retrovirus-related Pol polyprotein from transposon TNT 1-94 n=1 Tax=Tanacetum cinerariifolium TaxID=118510 RepID=A0A6L2NM24_TANCI|nr:hypothetical protein [Tanacetum cinerariifolium]